MQNHKEIFSSLGILDRYNVVYDWTNKDPLHPEAIGLVKKGEEQYPPEVIFFKKDGKFMYSFCAVVLDSLGSGYKYLDSEVGFDSLEECVNECYMKTLRPLDIKYNWKI